MSDVSLNVTVTPVTANVVLANTKITITPNPIAAVISAGGFASPAHGVSGDTQVQFNNGGILGGSPAMTWANSSNSLSVSGNITAGMQVTGNTATFNNQVNVGNLHANTDVTANNLIALNGANLGPVANLHITGGTNNTFLRTDGSGTLSFDTINLPTPQGSANSIQYNNAGVLGGIPTMLYDNANQFVNLGYNSNIKIQGGLNGYFLQTDGAGNLGWSLATSAGTGTVGGIANTIQYNNGGNFGGNVNFTYDAPNNTVKATNFTSNVLITANLINVSNVTVSSNLNATGNLNVTGLANLTTLTVNGTSKVQQAKEKVNISATSLTGTVNFDVLTSAISYYTGNIAGNITLNIRGASGTALSSVVNVGESLTVVLMTNIGPTVYIPTVIQVDGSTVTPKYSGGLTPFTGSSANSVGAFSYTVVRTGTSTYTILGSVGGFV
jgi:hypothetical protein